MANEIGGSPMQMQQLIGLIDTLRAKGVTKYTGPCWHLSDVIHLEFGAEPIEPAVEPERGVEVKGKVGKDGLTKDEQVDLYGRVIDAE